MSTPNDSPFPLCKSVGLTPLDDRYFTDEYVLCKDVEKILSEGIKITGDNDGSSGWVMSEIQTKNDTHSFIAINKQPIKKDPCKHEPIEWVVQAQKAVETFEHKCKHCGVKLKSAAWEEVE